MAVKHTAFFTICAKLTMAFTISSLPLNLYSSVSGCGCGFGFEVKFWRIDGFGEKRNGLADMHTPIHLPQSRTQCCEQSIRVHIKSVYFCTLKPCRQQCFLFVLRTSSSFYIVQILSLKRHTLEDAISENTINLVSNDAQAIELLSFAGFEFALVPLDIVVSVVLLWYLVAWQALIGASFFLLVVAYGLFAAHKAGKIREQSASVTDKRLEIMKEIIAGIRVVKMYAWEWNFTDVVAQIRRFVYQFDFQPACSLASFMSE